MFKNLKVGVKITIGFAAVLALLAVVSFVGYNSLQQVEHRVQNSNSAGEILEHTLQANTEEKLFEITGEESHFTQAGDFLESAREQAQHLMNDRYAQDGRELLRGILTEIDEYEAAFKEYTALEERAAELAEVWRHDGEMVDEEYNKVEEDIILPALRDAAENNDAGSLYRWAEIQRVFNESVIERFLNLRIAAVYFLKDRNEESWEAFQDADASLASGMEEWTAMVQGYPELTREAGVLRGIFDEYRSVGEEYHMVFLQEEEAEANMERNAHQVEEASLALRADQEEEMHGQIQRADMIIFVTAGIALVIGLLLALVIARGITGPVVKGVNFAKAIENVNEITQQAASAAEEMSASTEQLSGMVKEHQAETTAVTLKQEKAA